jgi:hypothetical protein
MASTADFPSERTARFCAEAALFMRDHVLSRVSHDLRSPLNAIHSWAYEAVDAVRSALAEARGVTLAVQGTPTGLTLDGDRERLVQALWLMLAFAAESSARGGSVTLGVSAAANAVQFDVTWTAAPQALTDASLLHLLEPLAREQALEPLETGRTAWVLALCQRVAEAHGGRFEQGALVEGAPAALGLNVPLA